MTTTFRPVLDRSFRGNISTHCKSTRIAVLAALLVASVASLVAVCAAQVKTPAAITIAQLAGPWQIALAGNIGCGTSSILFTGTLNASGAATGILSSASGCGVSTSTQTFTINSLNAHGTGTAGLSCGSGCGWNFDIQVTADMQTFNLVDHVNGSANVLAGTAVAATQVGAITVDQLAGPWQIALVGNTGCGRSSMLFTGTMNASGTAIGTLAGNSGCGASGSTQTFTINSLNANGSGTANLSCGTGCGWDFDIQVAPNKQIFNLVDVHSGGANVLAGTAIADVGSAIRVDQLAGPWQIALVGNTGCGATSMLFSGTLNTSGTATGTLTDASGCSGSSTQTFAIDSLSADGSGTASLSCGPACGWGFDIQVAPNKQAFDLVDLVNGTPNLLGGAAVAKPGFVIVPNVRDDPGQQASDTLRAVGLHMKVVSSSGSGPYVVGAQTPAGGTSASVGSTVRVSLVTIK